MDTKKTLQERALRRQKHQEAESRKKKLLALGWVNMSMLCHILTYIILVFGVFSGIFISMLYTSADIYRARIFAELT